MIKLATVFSGIGAIEHALDRMQLEHEIVFACDNGDVELELPKVSIDIDSMEKELNELKEIVKKVSGQIKDEENIDYTSQLDVMITAVEKEYKNLLDKLAITSDELLNKAVEESKEIIDAAIGVSTASKKKSTRN